MTPFTWDAWIGKKIVRCESKNGMAIIVLEDGRGWKFIYTGSQPFYCRDINGPLWPEE